MKLLQCQSVSLSLGHEPLFDEINLVIEKGEHLGLLGRNGEGKSTLLRLLAQDIEPDDGQLSFQKNLNIQVLSQTVPVDTDGSVVEVVATGLGPIGQLLIQYQQAIQANDEHALSKLHQKIESHDGWHLFSKVETVISKLQLPSLAKMSTLSGGMKRRVVLAKALLTEPDLLLLDEPTNHLDIQSIEWLENFLKNYPGAYLIVTHDRAFLQATTQAILEIDRGKLVRFNGNYQYYLKEKASQLAAEEKSNQEFDKKLAQEEKWIRQGIKARRTRNEGRVRALKALRTERAARRNTKESLNLENSSVKLSGKMVFEIKALNYQIADKILLKNFSSIVQRQDKIGIIGPNGCGKTTLLKLILGELKPTSGDIQTGTQIEVAYFDQMKDQIDDNLSAIDNVGQGSQTIEAFGKSQHIISYLKTFLFSPERAHSPVKFLSGGERSRLLLARLFTRNANVLVLDEPSNDLDIESLEMLEAFLVEFPGTILMVSHDRAFIENVVTSTWVYQGEGQFEEYVGGYQPYKIETERKKVSDTKSKVAPANKIKKLSYNEQRELSKLPDQIDTLESQIEKIQNKLADPQTYQQVDQEKKVILLNQELKQLEEKLDQMIERWEHLESLK